MPADRDQESVRLREVHHDYLFFPATPGRVASNRLGCKNAAYAMVAITRSIVSIWISSATWLLRSNLAAELFSGGGGYRLDPGADALLADAGSDRERASLALLILLDGDVSDDSRDAIQSFAKSRAGSGPGGAGALLHAVQNLPEAQLL